MFEVKDNDRNSSGVPVPDAAALTKNEVAALIRLTETHGLSGDAQVKFILRIRDLKQRAYAKSKLKRGAKSQESEARSD